MEWEQVHWVLKVDPDPDALKLSPVKSSRSERTDLEDPEERWHSRNQTGTWCCRWVRRFQSKTKEWIWSVFNRLVQNLLSPLQKVQTVLMQTSAGSSPPVGSYGGVLAAPVNIPALLSSLHERSGSGTVGVFMQLVGGRFGVSLLELFLHFAAQKVLQKWSFHKSRWRGSHAALKLFNLTCQTGINTTDDPCFDVIFSVILVSPHQWCSINEELFPEWKRILHSCDAGRFLAFLTFMCVWEGLFQSFHERSISLSLWFFNPSE